MKYVSVTVGLLAAALWLAAGALAPNADSYTEGRVFLLDKNGNPADLTDINATLSLTPKGGQAKNIRLEVVKPPMMKEGKEKEGMKEGMKHPVCGEVQSVRDYYVEFVINGPTGSMSMGMGKEEKKREEGRPGREYGIETPQSYQKGFMHDHGGPYYKADLRDVFQRDKPVIFTAEVTFNKKGDTWNAKFDYPIGLSQSIVRMAEMKFGKNEEFADANQWDKIHDTAMTLKMTIENYPPLAFKAYSEDATKFENARKACVESSTKIDEAVKAKDKDKLNEATKTCLDNLKAFSAATTNCEGASWK